jgi:hypothetical protein
LLSVKSGSQRRIFVPNLKMCRPRMCVTLSVHSNTFRSCVFGRWSKAEPCMLLYPLQEKSGNEPTTPGRPVSSKPLMFASWMKLVPSPKGSRSTTWGR